MPGIIGVWGTQGAETRNATLKNAFLPVIPANAGIQCLRFNVLKTLGPGVRRGDDED
jgi:hypothetical protein